jgi:hypothetical protein
MQGSAIMIVRGKNNNKNYITGKDSDMKVLESDYSNSTFHLASRSSMVGTAKNGQRPKTQMSHTG